MLNQESIFNVNLVSAPTAPLIVCHRFGAKGQLSEFSMSVSSYRSTERESNTSAFACVDFNTLVSG